MEFLRRIARAARAADRIDHVEARLAALERRLALAGPPPPADLGAAPTTALLPVREDAGPAAPEPRRETLGEASPPTRAAPGLPGFGRPTPRRVPSQGTRPGPERSDLERFVGVTVLGRLGVAALLLAAAYFAQLAYRHLGPVPRVLSIYGLAGLLVGVGFALRGRAAPRYVAILWGGGVAAAYLAGVVARLRYGIVDPLPATLLLVGACALGQALARRSGVAALAQVALVGAYAAPVLVGGPQDARTTLLVYLLALHTWAAWTERRWGWHGARGVAIVGTVVVATLWWTTHGRADLSTLLHAHAVLVGLAAPEILAVVTGRAAAGTLGWTALLLGVAELGLLVGAEGYDYRPRTLLRWPAVAGLLWLAPAVLARVRRGANAVGVPSLVGLGETLLVVGGALWRAASPTRDLPRSGAEVATMAGIGLLCLAGRAWWRAGDGPALFAAVLGLLFAVPLVPGDPASLLALAVPLGLALTGRTPWVRAVGTALAVAAPFAPLLRGDAPTWGVAAAFALSSAVAALVGWHARARRDAALGEGAQVAATALALLWGRLVASGAGLGEAAPLLGNPGAAAAAAVALALWAVTPRDPGRSGAVGLAAAGARLALGLLLLAAGWRETHEAVRGVESTDLAAVVETAYLGAAASLALVLGFVRRARGLRWGALALFGVVVAKVGIHDLDALETPYRVLITAGLGVVFLLAAYAYARRDRA